MPAPTALPPASSAAAPPGMAERVRSAVIWRSGSQILAQLVAWSSTFLVIRMLQPADYGLFAMTQVVMSLAGLMNGYSFAGALVQSGTADRERVRQVFGMLLLMNGGLALAQALLAPAAAAYFRQPELAGLLRIQALVHLLTPFIILPNALLARGIDFRTQARVNLFASLLAAAAGPACAFAGLGVWTLVIAPLVLFAARAVGLAVVGRWLVWPSFRMRGAGAVFGFGGAMLASDLFWFVQSQADVFVGGRSLDAHALGLYSTSLFLAQILVAKFVPALNEVAFPSYARLRDEAGGGGIGWAFAKAVRLVMLAVLPLYLGLAATAEPVVLTMLGPRWVDAVPIVRLLALAMPLVTLQILYAPATNALGRPGVTARVSAAGAVIMPIAFLIGVHWGPVGLAASWLAAQPLLALAATAISLPVIGLSARALIGAIRPGLAPAIAMAMIVTLVDHACPISSPALRLALLVAIGGASYAGLLLLTARPAVGELVAMVRGRRPAAAAA